MYGDKQDVLDLLLGPKSKFLNLEYSSRFLSIKILRFSIALCLVGFKFIILNFIFNNLNLKNVKSSKNPNWSLLLLENNFFILSQFFLMKVDKSFNIWFIESFIFLERDFFHWVSITWSLSRLNCNITFIEFKLNWSIYFISF